MAVQVEAAEPSRRRGRAGRDGACPAEQQRLGEALVAALELALVAAHRLLAGLDTVPSPPADTAAHLERARALPGCDRSLDERVLTLLELATPGAATGGAAVVQERPNEGHVGPALLDAGCARDRPESSDVGGATSPHAASACRAGLTRREREVLGLLAAGGSNREIAAALYLSPRTAERHVANIYLKLGAHSKAEAAAYALRHRLA